jgi:predicted RNase H-like HicB family nuclease
MRFKIVFDREEDGRWIAEIDSLPGVLAYGDTRAEAQSKVEALAFRVIASRFSHGSQ